MDGPRRGAERSRLFLVRFAHLHLGSQHGREFNIKYSLCRLTEQRSENDESGRKGKTSYFTKLLRNVQGFRDVLARTLPAWGKNALSGAYD